MSKKFKCTNLNETFLVSTPIANLEIECCSQGMHKLKFTDVSRELIALNKYRLKINSNFDHVKIISKMNESPLDTKESVLKYLEVYFCAKSCQNMIPPICWQSVCTEGTFTEKVMKILVEKVALGCRISYKELAALAGNINAQRAVGTVMSRNPIALVIPCHRVVNSNSKIGNYTGGSDIKEWLLEFEAKKFI